MLVQFSLDKSFALCYNLPITQTNVCLISREAVMADKQRTYFCIDVKTFYASCFIAKDEGVG